MTVVNQYHHVVHVQMVIVHHQQHVNVIHNGVVRHVKYHYVSQHVKMVVHVIIIMNVYVQVVGMVHHVLILFVMVLIVGYMVIAMVLMYVNVIKIGVV
jgi:hypothetical protein